MANINVSELMKMLSKMDKKDLEKGIAQASQILKNKDASNIINEVTKNNDSKN